MNMADVEDAPANPGLADICCFPWPVTVIIPTYNHADRLRRCLDALMQQDVAPDQFDVLVVDDGSQDTTAEVVAAYQEHPVRVQYLYQENRGPAAARNHGAEAAGGHVILFTDDDCEPAPDWLSQMCRPFADADRHVVAVKGAYRTRQQSLVARFAQQEFEDRYRKLSGYDSIDFVDTYSAAFRRDVFLELHGFDTRFPVADNEDVEFSYRMAARGYLMVFAPAAIVYHQHPDTLWGYLRTKFGRAYWRMAVYRLFPEKVKGDSYTPQLLKLQILLVLAAAGLLVPALIAGRMYRYGFLVVLGVFGLTAIPFMLETVCPQAWDKWSSRLLRFWRQRVVQDLPRRIFQWAARTPLGAVGRRLRVVFCRAGRRILGLLRAMLSWPCWQTFWQKLRQFFLFLWRGADVLWLAASRFLVVVLRVPGAIVRSLRRQLHSVYQQPWAQWVVRQCARLSRTRVVEAGLFFLLLLLRGLVMGLGIFWGLRAHSPRKGRFSQMVILLICDVIAILLACYVGYYVCFGLTGTVFHSDPPPMSLLNLAPFVALVTVCVFLLSGLYRPYRGLSQVNEFVVLAKAVATVGLATVVIVFMVGSPHSKGVILFTFFFMLLLVSLLRSVGRSLYARWSKNDQPPTVTRVLIVGTQEMARMICRRLESTGGFEASVLGFVRCGDEDGGTTVDGHPVLGSVESLGSLIHRFEIQDVFVALPMMSQDAVMELVHRHSDRPGVHFHIISNLFDLISAEVNIAENNNIPIAYLKNENMEVIQLVIKRIVDIVVAGLVLIVTLPFWLLIMLAIRVETDGPAVFLQERVGRGGKRFTIWKFRTMFADTEKFERSPAGPEDARITRVGRFLRRTSLDEFPQFWNVLKGDMSLVGPRPEMPFLVDQYKEWQRQRLNVRPGLTGLWQIMGRKDLPLHESLEYDFYYIKNQSLLLDLTILIKTVPVLLGGKGAY